MESYTNINELDSNSSITQTHSDLNTETLSSSYETKPSSQNSSSSTSSTSRCSKCCINFKTCKFHSVIVYLLLLSLLCLFTQMIQGGYMAAVMTNLQTQFNLSTSKIGFILSSFDIMGVIATPLLSYIGSKYNKCRVLGASGIFYVIGAVIYTLPYFIGDRYKIPIIENSIGNNSFNSVDFCKVKIPYYSNYTTLTTAYYNQSNLTDFINETVVSEFTVNEINNDSTLFSTTSSIRTTTITITSKTSSSAIVPTTSNFEKNKEQCSRDFSKTWPYAVFIIGQLFMSVGSAPLFSLGVTYLCDNLDERSHALYTGIVYGAFALGPAIGYLMASGLLSKWLYLDETPPIKDSDPKWVGCWFLGFIIASGLVLIISILLLSFPDAIRAEAKAKNAEKKKNRKKIKLETIQENDEIPSINFDLISSSISTTSTSITPSLSPTPTLKKKPSCGKRLINKINHSKIKFKGFLSSFLKLILNFRYALLVIIMSIECILVALFTNYMILYAQNVYQVSSSLSSILVGGVVVPSAILGAVVGGLLVKKFNLYIEGCVRLVILSSCVTIAGIFVLLFIRCETSPSLGIDTDKQIFNTSFSECNINCNCYASYNPICGSNNVTYVSPCYAGCKIINETGYYDCGCIVKNEENLITLDAKPGSCSMQCQTKLIVFLIVAFVVVFSETLSITPATMLVLKIIDKPLQPFALGLLRCANILLAYIPAPIVLSQVIDKTCVLWNNECQGDKGTCLEYNSFDFHFVLFGSAAGIKIVSGIFLIIFSIYIHKSYILRRKYRSKAVLNHDPGSILTPKQKYKIDCEVASSETSSLNSQDVSSIRYLYRKKKETLPRKESGITLKKHIILEDAYSLASQNQNDESNEKLSDFYDLTSSNYTTPVRQLNNDNDNGLITSNF